jgi:hypothetical protein
VSVAHPAGVHAGRCGAGAGADRASGGGGAQCRALRRRRCTARGARGVPARGLGDSGLPRSSKPRSAWWSASCTGSSTPTPSCAPTWTRRRAGFAC